MSRISKRTCERAKAAATEITFRPLTANDAKAYKTIRMKALTGKDKKFFAANVKAERSRTRKEWAEVCQQTCAQATMGAFHRKKLIATMSICLWEGDESGQTAYKHSAYVSPKYRGGYKNISISSGVDNARDTWAREHGCTQVVMGMRANNDHWRKEQEAKGAIVTPREKPVRYANHRKFPGIWLTRKL